MQEKENQYNAKYQYNIYVFVSHGIKRLKLVFRMTKAYFSYNRKSKSCCQYRNLKMKLSIKNLILSLKS